MSCCCKACKYRTPQTAPVHEYDAYLSHDVDTALSPVLAQITNATPRPKRRQAKASSSCLGRCDLPRHRCLEKEDVKPGPVPRHMGWMYGTKDSPKFQKRCGWRPGHISCTVLRRIEAHNGSRDACNICPSKCSSRPPCSRPCSPCSRVCSKPCLTPCGLPSVCSASPSPPPIIRIIRHAGQYQICTKPSNLNNSPSGPNPLKYVFDTEPAGAEDAKDAKNKYSIEAKFNDYQYDYTSSQSSFVIDFTPPASPSCGKPCAKKPCSIICMFGLVENTWPPAKNNKKLTKLAFPASKPSNRT